MGNLSQKPIVTFLCSLYLFIYKLPNSKSRRRELEIGVGIFGVSVRSGDSFLFVALMMIVLLLITTTTLYT